MEAAIPFVMRIKWLSVLLVLFVGFSYSNAQLKRRPPAPGSFDPQLIEGGVWAPTCGGEVLTENEDPGAVIRKQIVKPSFKAIYMEWLKELPKAAKQPENAKAMAQIEFRVLANGSIDSERLVRSAGLASVVEASQNALKRASVPAFPEQIHLRWIRLSVMFVTNSQCADYEMTH